MEKCFFIHSKTFKVLHDSIPNGIDWLKVPEGTALIYHFDGSDPIGDDSIVFYKEGLSHTWNEALGWTSSGFSSPRYYGIMAYVTTHGKLVWSKGVKKELFDTMEKGTKLRIISLDNTSVGDSGFSIGDEVLFVRTKSASIGHTIIVSCTEFGKTWGISHKDVEVVEVVDVGSSINCKQTTYTTQTEQTNTFKPIKSDGGSSSYYFTKLPEHLIEQIVETGGIEIKDIVRYCFDNDADCKDIIKALKRIRESSKGGGKEGITIQYDLNKITFFLEEMKTAHSLLGGF